MTSRRRVAARSQGRGGRQASGGAGGRGVAVTETGRKHQVAWPWLDRRKGMDALPWGGGPWNWSALAFGLFWGNYRCPLVELLGRAPAHDGPVTS